MSAGSRVFNYYMCHNRTMKFLNTAEGQICKHSTEQKMFNMLKKLNSAKQNKAQRLESTQDSWNL